MKYVVLGFAFVSILLCAAVALGQTPPPAPPPAYDPYSYSYLPPRPVCGWWEFWCGDSVYRNPNLSPVTKKMLYDHDPNVCHCDQCTRLRLAAGVEYTGLDSTVYTPRRLPPIPSLYSPVFPKPAPQPQPWRNQMLIFCRSTNSVIARGECADK